MNKGDIWKIWAEGLSLEMKLRARRRVAHPQRMATGSQLSKGNLHHRPFHLCLAVTVAEARERQGTSHHIHVWKRAGIT